MSKVHRLAVQFKDGTISIPQNVNEAYKKYEEWKNW